MKKNEIQNAAFVLLMLLIAGAVAYLATMELRKENSLLQTELDGRKKENVRERDSLQTQLAITRDSLSVAFETIRQATKEREASHLRTQKTIRDLQRIVFIQHNDSSRTAELKTLYKSY